MSQTAKIQALLSAEGSTHRRALIALVFDGLAACKLGDTIDRALLLEGVAEGLRASSVDLIAQRHVLPAVDRVASQFAGKQDTLRDLLGEPAAQLLGTLVRSGQGPRFAWVEGALDADDLRQLIAPVIQQMLLSFVNSLPLPGLGALAGKSKGAGGVGSLMGAIGKQVSRSIGDIADVGRNVIGTMAKDFSQSAANEVRGAVRARMKTPEGRRAVEHIRGRVLEHVLATQTSVVIDDFMHLPRAELARVAALAVEHLRTQATFKELLERELGAALDELKERTLGELLTEIGVLESTRKQVLHAVDPLLQTVVASDGFTHWLDTLLTEAT